MYALVSGFSNTELKMTRPLGKSPARSKPIRPQLDLKSVSLIDVRAEDDSLLPGKGDASQQKKWGPVTPSRPVASPFKASGVKSLACIQEDQPDCEEMQGINGDEAQDMLAPLATGEPAVKKKKKKTGFNLRKSLAWNNAFFTEEGVLDPEELSLVNRTFRKPFEEPKPSSNKKPALTSKLLNPSAISKLNFSPIRFQKPPIQAESRHHNGALGSSPVNNTGNASKRADLHNYGVKGFAASKHGVGGFSRVQADLNKHVKNDKSMVPNRTEFQGLKPSPLKKQIEENLRTVSGPALPAYSSPKPPLDRAKHNQSLASTLSSASKKMKDRLGMVFSGRTVGNVKGGIKSTAEDDAVVPSSTATDYLESAKLTRCYSHSSYERFGRSTIATATEPAISKVGVSLSNTNTESRSSNLQGTFASKGAPSSTYTGFPSSLQPKSSLHNGKEQTPAALFSHTQGIGSFARPPHPNALPDIKSISQETGGSEVLLSKVKPSGLRMPSPKLGFFDKPRTTNAAHIAVLRERTNGLGYDGASLQPSRNVGAMRPLIDVGGMSNIGKQSNGYVPQSIRNTGRQPIENATVNNYTKQPSMLKPPVSFVNSSQLQSEALGQSNTTNVLCSIPTAPHLRYTESSSKPITFSMMQGPSSMSSGPCTTSSVVPSNLNPLTLPGSSSVLPGSDSIIYGQPSNSSYRTGSQVSETGSQVNDTGVVLQVQKNVQNVLPEAKRIVTQLCLSPLRIVSGQENLLLEHPQDKESSRHSPEGRGKSCCNEDAGGALATETQEEWPQVKSGAVQHSPPNKEPPKYGPWSPVRRNAPELGPFDCTKYTNTGILH